MSTKELQTYPLFTQSDPYMGEDPEIAQTRMLQAAIGFTKTYREHLDQPVAIREARCLGQQYPALCREIQDYDLLAGRIFHNPLVGFGLEFHANASVKTLNEDTIPRRTMWFAVGAPQTGIT